MTETSTAATPRPEVPGPRVTFRTEFGRLHAVKGSTSGCTPGEVVALVGESGSGKSVSATTALDIAQDGHHQGPKTAFVADQAIGGLSGGKLRAIRGNKVAMVFREPMTA